MTRYIGKRSITGILTIIFTFTFTFFLVRSAPGDPIAIMAGTDNPNPEQIQALTEKYGLDKPIITQFTIYLKNVLKGDLGYSYRSNEPVIKLIGEKIGATILLSLSGAISSLIIGTVLGIYAARHVGSIFDKLMCSISYIFDSVPAFWVGLMLILIFASKFKILPTSGMIDLRNNYEGFALAIDILKHLILPVMTLTIVQIPSYFRIARSSVIQVMSEDYITTLRATGMKESIIFNKYVLRNAILPIITMFSISLAFIITGVTLIEIVFAWPGMGRLMMDSIMKRDFPVLTGLYLVISISVSIVMILTDVVYGLVDPRIRYE